MNKELKIGTIDHGKKTSTESMSRVLAPEDVHIIYEYHKLTSGGYFPTNGQQNRRERRIQQRKKK